MIQRRLRPQLFRLSSSPRILSGWRRSGGFCQSWWRQCQPFGLRDLQMCSWTCWQPFVHDIGLYLEMDEYSDSLSHSQFGEIEPGFYCRGCCFHFIHHWSFVDLTSDFDYYLYFRFGLACHPFSADSLQVAWFPAIVAFTLLSFVSVSSLEMPFVVPVLFGSCCICAGYWMAAYLFWAVYCRSISDRITARHCVYWTPTDDRVIVIRAKDSRRARAMRKISSSSETFTLQFVSLVICPMNMSMHELQLSPSRHLMAFSWYQTFWIAWAFVAVNSAVRNCLSWKAVRSSPSGPVMKAWQWTLATVRDKIQSLL